MKTAPGAHSSGQLTWSRGHVTHELSVQICEHSFFVPVVYRAPRHRYKETPFSKKKKKKKNKGAKTMAHEEQSFRGNSFFLWFHLRFCVSVWTK